MVCSPVNDIVTQAKSDSLAVFLEIESSDCQVSDYDLRPNKVRDLRVSCIEVLPFGLALCFGQILACGLEPIFDTDLEAVCVDKNSTNARAYQNNQCSALSGVDTRMGFCSFSILTEDGVGSEVDQTLKAIVRHHEATFSKTSLPKGLAGDLVEFLACEAQVG